MHYKSRLYNLRRHLLCRLDQRSGESTPVSGSSTRHSESELWIRAAPGSGSVPGVCRDPDWHKSYISFLFWCPIFVYFKIGECHHKILTISRFFRQGIIYSYKQFYIMHFFCTRFAIFYNSCVTVAGLVCKHMYFPVEIHFKIVYNLPIFL